MTDNVVEVASSAMLTGVLPALPVAADTAGRTAKDFTAFTLPATRMPRAMA